jgi:hypothetical protein
MVQLGRYPREKTRDDRGPFKDSGYGVYGAGAAGGGVTSLADPETEPAGAFGVAVLDAGCAGAGLKAIQAWLAGIIAQTMSPRPAMIRSVNPQGERRLRTIIRSRVRGSV